jgi:uncharacterized protein (DUF736 family)
MVPAGPRSNRPAPHLVRDRSSARDFIGVFVVTLALGLAVGAVWEMTEYTSDHYFGTHLARSERPHRHDLMVDGLGVSLTAP